MASDVNNFLEDGEYLPEGVSINAKCYYEK